MDEKKEVQKNARESDRESTPDGFTSKASLGTLNPQPPCNLYDYRFQFSRACMVQGSGFRVLLTRHHITLISRLLTALPARHYSNPSTLKFPEIDTNNPTEICTDVMSGIYTRHHTTRASRLLTALPTRHHSQPYTLNYKPYAHTTPNPKP